MPFPLELSVCRIDALRKPGHDILKGFAAMQRLIDKVEQHIGMQTAEPFPCELVLDKVTQQIRDAAVFDPISLFLLLEIQKINAAGNRRAFGR